MLIELQRLKDKNEDLELDDIRRASSFLLQKQFIYANKSRDKATYQLITNFRDYYWQLFDAINMDLEIDLQMGYIALLPRTSHLSMGLDLTQTLLLLCMRLIYEKGVRECRAEEGIVRSNSDVLIDVYQAHTHRKLPPLGELRSILQTFSSQSLLDIEKDKQGLGKVINFQIRPAIRLVMSEEYLAQLEEFSSEQQVKEGADEEA